MERVAKNYKGIVTYVFCGIKTSKVIRIYMI